MISYCLNKPAFWKFCVSSHICRLKNISLNRPPKWDKIVQGLNIFLCASGFCLWAHRTWPYFIYPHPYQAFNFQKASLGIKDVAGSLRAAVMWVTFLQFSWGEDNQSMTTMNCQLILPNNFLYTFWFNLFMYCVYYKTFAQFGNILGILYSIMDTQVTCICILFVCQSAFFK